MEGAGLTRREIAQARVETLSRREFSIPGAVARR
jgi:hypothetical protein